MRPLLKHTYAFSTFLVVYSVVLFQQRKETGLVDVKMLFVFCRITVSLSEIYCTACSRQIMPDQDSARRHPVLKVLICKVSNSFIFHLIIFDPLFICIHVSVMS